MIPARPPSKFYKALAAGAPAPFMDKPVRLERMIHFVAPHVEKIRAKVPGLIKQVDVVLGNLEDAIPARIRRRRGRGSSNWRARTNSGARAFGRVSTL